MSSSYSEIYTNAKKTVKGWFGASGGGGASKANLEMAKRQRTGNTALSFYESNAPKQLLVKPGQPDDNIAVNYAETIVDKGVTFLFGDELKISVGSDQDARGEQHLDSVWDKDRRSEDLIDAASDGAIFGDAYLKICIDESGQPEVVVLDPLNMSVETDPQNYKKVLKYICQFEQTEDSGKSSWHKEEVALENGRWVVREFESKNGGSWLQIGEDALWPYSRAPIFHCKNLPLSKSFYGKADLRKSTLDLCRIVSRTDSIISKIGRVHGSPKPVATGIQKQDLQVGTEDVLFLPQAEAKLQLLEMSGDLMSLLAFRREMREALAEISNVPDVSRSKTEIGQLSGKALRILYAPLIDQTKKKQRLYGKMIRDVAATLLEIGNLKNLSDKVELQWGEPVPSDPKEEAETGIALKQIGVSEDTIMKRLGFDPEYERKMRKLDSNYLGDALGQAFDGGRDAQARVDHKN